ncbi:outer envelope membrane protein 7 [Punica granatum]|nr:outer envelope membrane protein 7 [Punica granatum]
MAAITSALIAIAGVVLGWIAIEIACKPCLERGREAIDRSLNPDYDPDDEENRAGARAPLIAEPEGSGPTAEDPPSASTASAKAAAI